MQEQEPRLNRAAKQYKRDVLRSIANCRVLDSDPLEEDCEFLDGELVS